MEGYNIDDERVNDRVVNPIYKYAGSYAGWTHLNVPRSLSFFNATLERSLDLPAFPVSTSQVFFGFRVIGEFQFFGIPF